MKDLLKKYQSLGWYLVPLQKGDKRPIREHWNLKENCLPPGEEITETLGGVGLAHAYSRTCTIDLDDLEKAREWFGKKGLNIDKYLNAPESVKILSGVKNKAKLLYLLPPDAELLPHVKRDSDGFELRCATRKGTTVQDALPPSIHPKTNKPYTWIGDPAKTPILPIEFGKIWFEFIDNNKSHVPVRNAEALIPFIESAITTLSPDMDYNDWLAVGFALHSVGPDLIDVWDEWSSDSSKYNLGDCESRWLGFDQGGGVTLGTFFKYAYDQGWTPQTALIDIVRSHPGTSTELVKTMVELCYHMSVGPMLMEEVVKEVKKITGSSIKAIRTAWNYELGLLLGEAGEGDENLELTHSEIVDVFITQLKAEYPPAVVANAECLWYYSKNYWHSADRDMVGGKVARQFSKQKFCKTGAQYSQIAKHAVSADMKPRFFSNAPDGAATLDGFYRILEDGKIEKEPNMPEHRQRWLIPAEPNKGKMPLFDSLLRNALGHDIAQMKLLQQVFGAVIFNKLSISYQKAVIFYGEASTGKSVLIDVLRALFPEERTTTISPEKFGSEYNLASLANSALNTYEELPDAKSISSPEFKALVSGGKMMGRPIFGKPVEFRARASHVFSSNYLPTTNEVDAAFFRRWILFDFKNPVKGGDPDFTSKIIKQELGQIFQWGIDGMKSLIKDNGFAESSSNELLMQRWTRTSNIVLEFIHDPEYILLGDEAHRVKRSELFTVFKEWCRYHDRKAIMKGEFNHRVEKAITSTVVDGIHFWQKVGIVMDRPGF